VAGNDVRQIPPTGRSDGLNPGANFQPMVFSIANIFTLIAVLFIAGSRVDAAEPHRLAVDFATVQGELRALHGINKGPLSANGLIDVTEAQRRLRVPSIRLHDCHHPNPDVVDVHAVFPNPEADPSLPASYDFRATDEYIAAVRATGAEVIYRLGESIEHQTVKRHVHPPRDPARWAAVCAGIVRHYNEGWAAGFRYGIRYWEIWNEPENRPVMWTGTDAQFLELYRMTARTLRKEFPSIKIGGPGFGYYGKFNGTNWQPSEFCAAFLDLCRNEKLPLDFFSWHCYTDNPAELAARARAVRRVLDARGFTQTESHLNEWNYLPGNSWSVMSRKSAPEVRQRGIEQMMGAAGGAFLVASLIEFQDAPVDVCNFFHGETGIFGLFTEVGAPTRNYHSMLAFAQLLDTPRRVRTTGAVSGKLAIAAGTREGNAKAAVLVANLNGAEEIRLSLTNLPWAGNSTVELRIVDGQHAFELRPGAVLAGSELRLKLAPPSVALLTLLPRTRR
jgi:xylan 1,4-beta-xylosidase